MARDKRVYKAYEKEAIIEHITIHREKHGLSLERLSAIREEIEGAGTAALQVIVAGLYGNDALRRSLLRHLRVGRQGEKKSPYVTLSVKREVKELFDGIKKQYAPGGENSDFLCEVLKQYESKAVGQSGN